MIFNRTTKLSDLVAALNAEGGVTIHLPAGRAGGPGYNTLCGLDVVEEPESARQPLPRGARVNCVQCIATWYEAKTIPGSFIHPDALLEALDV